MLFQASWSHGLGRLRGCVAQILRVSVAFSWLLPARGGHEVLATRRQTPPHHCHHRRHHSPTPTPTSSSGVQQDVQVHPPCRLSRLRGAVATAAGTRRPAGWGRSGRRPSATGAWCFGWGGVGRLAGGCGPAEEKNARACRRGGTAGTGRGAVAVALRPSLGGNALRARGGGAVASGGDGGSSRGDGGTVRRDAHTGSGVPGPPSRPTIPPALPAWWGRPVSHGWACCWGCAAPRAAAGGATPHRARAAAAAGRGRSGSGGRGSFRGGAFRKRRSKTVVDSSRGLRGGGG